MDYVRYLLAVLVFIAVATGVEALWQFWFSTQSKAAKRTRRRMETVAGPSRDRSAHVSLLKQRRLADSLHVEGVLKRIPGIHALDAWVQQSGSKDLVGRLIFHSGLAFGITLMVLKSFGVAVATSYLFALLAGVVPAVLIANRRTKRMDQLERQLPEAADLIARSLRAGHAFAATLQMVADELPEPISNEFRIVADEINFGLPMVDSLHRLAARVPLDDLRFFVIAVMIQRETGGNLAELMNNLSQLIRQRLKLLGQVRALSAEGRVSAWVLGLLPVVVALVLLIVNPAYIRTLFTDPMGKSLIGTALGLMLVGVLWMRSIIRIRV